MNPPDSHNSSKSQTSYLGNLGEDFVSEWLELQNWSILHQRWHGRSGELDIVARLPHTLAFVEVKTRSKGNWDNNGLLAITPTKQAKLWRTAEQFLIKYPELATLPCRFDVALVTCHPVTPYTALKESPKKKAQPKADSSLMSSERSFTRTIAGYQLTLHSYIQEAFTVELD